MKNITLKKEDERAGRTEREIDIHSRQVCLKFVSLGN